MEAKRLIDQGLSLVHENGKSSINFSKRPLRWGVLAFGAASSLLAACASNEPPSLSATQTLASIGTSLPASSPSSTAEVTQLPNTPTPIPTMTETPTFTPAPELPRLPKEQRRLGLKFRRDTINQIAQNIQFPYLNDISIDSPSNKLTQDKADEEVSDGIAESWLNYQLDNQIKYPLSFSLGDDFQRIDVVLTYNDAIVNSNSALRKTKFSTYIDLQNFGINKQTKKENGKLESSIYPPDAVKKMFALPKAMNWTIIYDSQGRIMEYQGLCKEADGYIYFATVSPYGDVTYTIENLGKPKK